MALTLNVQADCSLCAAKTDDRMSGFTDRRGNSGIDV
jgi:hypothetical protein